MRKCIYIKSLNKFEETFRLSKYFFFDSHKFQYQILDQTFVIPKETKRQIINNGTYSIGMVYGVLNSIEAYNFYIFRLHYLVR